MAQIATRITEEEKRELEEYCKNRDIKISWLIRQAIREYMKNH